jgi:hypothetical protein
MISVNQDLKKSRKNTNKAGKSKEDNLPDVSDLDVKEVN